MVCFTTWSPDLYPKGVKPSNVGLLGIYCIHLLWSSTYSTSHVNTALCELFALTSVPANNTVKGGHHATDQRSYNKRPEKADLVIV